MTVNANHALAQHLIQRNGHVVPQEELVWLLEEIDDLRKVMRQVAALLTDHPLLAKKLLDAAGADK